MAIQPFWCKLIPVCNSPVNSDDDAPPQMITVSFQSQIAVKPAFQLHVPFLIECWVSTTRHASTATSYPHACLLLGLQLEILCVPPMHMSVL